MAIEPARPEDATAIREVARAAWRSDYPLTRETVAESVDEWYDPERTRAAVEADDAVVLVAWGDGDDRAADGTVVGFAHSVVGPRADEATILRVYVRPDARRTDLGTRPVEATLERLRARDVTDVEATVLDADDTGAAFYRSLGFEHDRTEETVIAGEKHPEAVYVYVDAEDG